MICVPKRICRMLKYMEPAGRLCREHKSEKRVKKAVHAHGVQLLLLHFFY